ncbi:ABC-2 family transporter protein [Oscillatoria sp. FACHB-1406]|uniref:ABC transporter permease n=1 Tax=Oscillatoria sp. FACHB-1406 TaxID=2692846 RepID=UPI00168868D3|nr:ABC-2 family transporter protein [Oscillatoria sp. FACHB-1406]MBD2580405.1 ABC-2 family transporter protein [Oscillatoria sp. FACHB-1406]
MKWIFKQISTFLVVYYAFMVEYRAELFFWVLSNSLPIILMGVWIEAARGGNFGLSPVEFARYFLAVFIVRQFTIVWVIWDFEREIVEGRLSFRLLQPIDPVWHHLAGHLTERLARSPFVVVLVALFFWLYPQARWIPSWGTLLLFAVAIALAFALRFLMQYTYAMFAFWTERATAIEQFFYLFFLFLSGMIAPLDVFPPAAREFALWTPFPYLMYFPTALLVDLKVDIWRGFAVLIAWMAIFFFINRWLWRRGLKQYSGMGA